MVNREVDSTSPPIPAVPFAKFGSDPPRYCQANPAGIPGGVSGIWPTSATVLGFVSPQFRGGGSGLGSQAAEPFAIGWPRPNSARAGGAFSGSHIRAAVKRWPKDKITLRNRARVIEQSWRD